MTRYMTAGAAAVAATLTMGSAALADAMPDLRGTRTASQTTVSPSNANTATAPRFNTSEWVLEIQAQHENVFWGPSMWRRNAMDDWTMYEATGSISQDGSGKIGIVETAADPTSGVNALIDARYEDGKIYADFRSLRTGTTYSTVLERQVN
ncbi:hypothetical protein [Ruegeria arenilitoris]|uniref:hypothetical protein n=1 Tax=Ruegeria arenilitoris TaxID=1173585 RepID=UPI001480184A|nr:hypothetical protein [Ruegeria arenilitoris]